MGTKVKSKPICFSFAAYANNILERLKSSNVVIEEGLSDAEFSNIETRLKFTFPPDVRAILQQGLPTSTGFPNWRSSSKQQLQILLNLPSLSILRRVNKTRFWHRSWGTEPGDPVQTVRGLLNDAPTLVPIYRHCYIPSSPNVAGNPVFYVDHDGDVRLLSFDVAGFFREFLAREPDEPVWAATAPRRVRFWSEIAEARGGRWRWWWGGGVKGELSGCLEGVVWRLREGGWKEEEIREMMMLENEEEENENKEKIITVMMDDEYRELHEHLHLIRKDEKKKKGLSNKEQVAWHVRLLALVLLRAGWSREDVVYSLGVNRVVPDEGKPCLELQSS
ncbi:hypothetical protein RJT34_05617 [Clitoria ternatea]|uniref:Knr4/Smi1-like domain-containing protein n=1 Tax=Clitoria ternatea TaxID=43366 RepID=A0AAN9K3W2_CLITE